MKTLAVLAALAAVATAVPALPGYNYGYRSAYNGLPTNIRREKKSPELLTSDVTPAEDIPETGSTHEVSARTFGLKKPIIVKQKMGYHLYRDSDEERANGSEDPQEKCAKEVTVKLCDPALSSDQKRSTTEDTIAQLTETDVKHSIKMAKEAVENLQKVTQFKKLEAGPDAEMHEDIEVARQALEHIQQNFGNLESMNLQATTLSEAEALQSSRLQIAKTETGRIAQWKEAIENIQKNTEIAKNIEDSFITSPESEAIKQIKSSKSANTADVIVAKNSLAKSNDEKVIDHDIVDLKKNVDHMHEMVPAASELKESKAALPDAPVFAKDAAVKLEEIKVNDEDDKQEIHKDLLKAVETDDSATKMENIKHIKATENMEADLTSAASAPAVSTVLLTDTDGNLVNAKKWSRSLEHEKAVEIDTTSLMKSAEHEMKQHHEDLVQAKDTQGQQTTFPPILISTEHQDLVTEMRAHEATSIQQQGSGVTHTPEFKSSIQELQQPIASSPSFFKSAADNQVMTTEVKAVESNTMDHLPLEALHRSQANTNEIKSAQAESIQSENLPPVFKSADLKSENLPTSFKSADHKGESFPSFIKSVDHQTADISSSMRVPDSNNMQQQLHESDFHLQVQGKNWNDEKMALKTENDEVERNANIGIHTGAHMMPSMHHQGQFGLPMHGLHAEPHLNLHHHHHMGHFNHGKSADMDSATAPSTQVNVNEVAGKAAMDHGSMMNWKQKEVARGAYGPGPYGSAVGASGLNLAAGGGSGPGAVGVFPGASVGGCAIPLLLSCSPSVVPGTLAKAPAYGAPHAYRAASEFDSRFHNKRDTKKTTEIVTKVKRTPTKVIQKIPLEEKL